MLTLKIICTVLLLIIGLGWHFAIGFFGIFNLPNLENKVWAAWAIVAALIAALWFFL